MPPAHTPPIPHPAQAAERPGWWLAWALAALLVAAGAALQLSGLNLPLLAAWQASALRGLDHPVLWSSLTVLGLGWAVLLLAAALSRRAARLVTLVLLASVLGAALTHGPKRLLATPRPAAVWADAPTLAVGEPIFGGGALPSGHALAAAALATLLVLGTRPGSASRRLLWWAAPLGAVAVAASRLAVVAHWPADVLVGAGLGVCTALAALLVARHPWAHRMDGFWPTARGQCWLAALELLAALALLATRTGYPQGWPMQWALAALGLGSACCRLWAVRQAAAPSWPLATWRASR